MQKERQSGMLDIWRAGATALLILAAAPMLAQEAPSAVGRISYGDALKPGAAICTGTLVAADLVLTARHCLEGAQENPGTVQFAAAYAAGQSAALGQGAEVILSGAAVTRLRANDVALLRLQAPMAAEAVAPLPLANPALAKMLPKLSVIAYRRDAPEQAERHEDCALVTTVPGILGLSCPVVSGNSGAPVLVWDGSDWQILAVMVASDKLSQVQALAALVPADLVARILAARITAKPQP
jgi:protease YdgD